MAMRCWNHLFADDLKQGHGNGHDPQAADLDQKQDDPLAERAEIAAGVHHDQPGDAHGRRGREQGVDHADIATHRGGR
jgi:hypothetical protein